MVYIPKKKFLVVLYIMPMQYLDVARALMEKVKSLKRKSEDKPAVPPSPVAMVPACTLSPPVHYSYKAGG